MRTIAAGPAFTCSWGQTTRRAVRAPDDSYWMAMEGGLSNGEVVYGTTPYAGVALLSDDCRDVAAGSASTIWVATAAGVVRVLGGRFSLLHAGSSDLPSDDVRAVVVDAQDRPWFATAAGVVWFDGAGFQRLGGANGLPSDEVRDLEIDAQGRIWAATDAGLARSVGDVAFEAVPVADDPGGPEPALHVVDSLPDGRVLAGSREPGPGAGLYVVQASDQVAHYTTAEGRPTTGSTTCM